MIKQPFESGALKIRKIQILAELEKILDNQALATRIREMVGEDFSMTSILKKAIGLPGIDPITAKLLRKEIETSQPQGLQLFDELVKTCNELAKVDNPLIVY